MKQKEIIDYAESINVARMALLSKRNTDYSEQDVDNGLSNFHDVSNICKTLGINVKASEVAFILGVLKLVRDANKKRLGEAPDSLVRTDNYRDFHNYIDLSALCEIEENRPDHIPGVKVYPSEHKLAGLIRIEENNNEV